MTAINENGQIYWTFEELDLEGALQLVEKQIDELLKTRHVLHKTSVRLGSENEFTRAKLYLEVSQTNGRRIKNLCDVQENIIGLMIRGLKHA